MLFLIDIILVTDILDENIVNIMRMMIKIIKLKVQKNRLKLQKTIQYPHAIQIPKEASEFEFRKKNIFIDHINNISQARRTVSAVCNITLTNKSCMGNEMWGERWFELNRGIIIREGGKCSCCICWNRKGATMEKRRLNKVRKRNRN